MLIKNIGKKCIGFGALVLTPDAVGALPGGYSLDHPTVKFYLEKGWIAPVKGGGPGPAEQKARAVSKMSLEPLREEATALGIEWTEDDTKPVLRQKITEKLQTEKG
jgi:hypothetical protein